MMILCFILILGGSMRSVDQQEVSGLVERFVHAKLQQRGISEDISVEMRSSTANFPKIPSGATLRVIDNGSVDLRNNILLPLEAVVENRVEHTFLVSARIRRFGNVLLAAERIDRKQSGESVIVSAEKIETTTLAADILSSGESLKGKRAKRIINRGTVLTESMFEQMPTVLQGNPVTLLVRSNSVTIKTRAIVREDGLPGDIIEVQKAGSPGRVKARVVDEHTVEILAQN